jgi:hypothetical protein
MGSPGVPYDVNTPVGQTRFHAADTDAANYVFSDAEINYCLGSVGQNDPVMSASFLLEALAANRSRLAIIVSSGLLQITSKVDPTKAAELLAERAATLRDLSNVSAPIQTPDKIFSTDNTALGELGTMDGW